MAFWSAFEQEIFSQIVLADPSAVPPNGSGAIPTIITSVSATRKSIVEEMKSGTFSVPLPCWFVEFGQLAPDTGFSVDARARRAPVTIYRLDKRTATQAAVTDLLLDLAGLFDGPDASFDTLQAIEQASVDASETSPINTLMRESKVQAYGGHCSWQPGFLVYPYDQAATPNADLRAEAWALVHQALSLDPVPDTVAPLVAALAALGSSDPGA